MEKQRRTLRTRKLAGKLSIVDEDERKRARKARLDALENDVSVVDDTELDNPDDEEFVLNDIDSDDSIANKKQKKKPTKSRRQSRGPLVGKGRGPKTLQDWIEQDGLEEYPDYEPSYLTCSAAPPKFKSPRNFCSVCGQNSRYTCLRCGSKYCSIKCSAIHNETRCLKFTA